MPARSLVHVVVPDAVDDPTRPSGGNVYDRRVCDLLPDLGWPVHEHAVPDAWPQLGAAGRRALAAVVSRIPDGALVLVDGLIAETGAPVLVSMARRSCLVVLVHSVPADAAAADALAAARAVIATSSWLRRELVRRYALPAGAVRVAEPGVEVGPVAAGTARGGELLCVGSVAPHKGHDVLLAALARLPQLQWHCRCVGSLDHDASYAAAMCRVAQGSGVADRLRFTGPRTGAQLEAAFGSADVLVHPARVEGYGMVVVEALAHGLPVITTTAGGLPDALGATPDGERPGLLVPPGDPTALAGALSAWLTDRDLRDRLRRAACGRRAELPSWSVTAEQVASVLRELR
ncbi:glycosyltransferase family 4 protein [Jatrophihabitans cynanchi]|jgi:glycosyltransferase involved in cell wall biosynthesis|uniref:Glycosyltransferase family 4 protein n=1 Tax=Jatrophihabitans cynanchi TaxID=2944128 RepID=A0ABY7K0P9_9ACTN|nr:glycosyltransferase family 4 protein [Jatrophihabitans sp. SB3-54]WAX57152.1 glycosyltransferase family 4 protein [Jatrophihabitans sp. SB3-54]